MALDKQNKNYYYNLGRVVSLVKIINDLDPLFVSRVYDNASDKLPYQLREALKKHNHSLIGELVECADVVLKNDFPTHVLAPEDGGMYWFGYYHENKYLSDTYNGVYGNVETEISEHCPDPIVVSSTSNDIESLKK